VPLGAAAEAGTARCCGPAGLLPGGCSERSPVLPGADAEELPRRQRWGGRESCRGSCPLFSPHLRGALLHGVPVLLSPRQWELRVGPGCGSSTEIRPVGSEMALPGTRWQLGWSCARAGSGQALGLGRGPASAVAGPKAGGLGAAWERCAGDCPCEGDPDLGLWASRLAGGIWGGAAPCLVSPPAGGLVPRSPPPASRRARHGAGGPPGGPRGMSRDIVSRPGRSRGRGA